jgi:hypothetical protein
MSRSGNQNPKALVSVVRAIAVSSALRRTRVWLVLLLLILSCGFLGYTARAQECTRSIIFADDFESDPSPRWTISRESTDPSTFVPRDWTWVHTLPDGRSGSGFFAADPKAFELCSAPSPGQVGVLLLESPAITLPGDFQGGLRLSFDHWVSVETGFDGAQLMISVNGGPYVLVGSASDEDFISNPYNFILFPFGDNPRLGQRAWSGELNNWGTTIVDLSRYAQPGDTIRLRWDMSTDYCFGTDAGWYVDNVHVYTCLAGTDLLTRIRALPHVVSATLAPSDIPHTFFFRILFEQPVDHDRPDGPVFLQRVTLLHRSEASPTVLQLHGYYISPSADQSELTYLLESNQISVEHRFFPPSSPVPPAWGYLTIAQSAADHHRIVESFKNLYSGKWVSTGRSKGGMAAVYHRFFYPSDVDVTVPYVAPSSHGTRDARYVQFVDQLGTAVCREKLLGFQQTALARRAELLPLIPAYGFDILGADRALEFAIVETPFIFWQYSQFNSCDSIPQQNASATQLFDFLASVTGLFSYSDPGLNAYSAYYYQAATELGGPRYDERRLQGLLSYPREDVPESYPPLGVEKDFNRALMERIEQWVQTSGEQMLFIYGATDPWSASAFDPKAKNDSHRLFVTGNAGDHLAGIFDLSDPDFSFASDKLTQWLNSAQPDLATKRVRARGSHKEFAQPTRSELFLR